MSNSNAVLLLLCMLASSLDFGDSIGHHLRDNFNVGNRGDQISAFHHVDADGHGYHAEENIDNEVGKDKHKVITNAKLTATVMASDFHQDSYIEHHEDENEEHVESSKDLMLDTANQHGAVRHHLDSVLADESSDDSSDDEPAGVGKVQSGWAGAAPSPALSPPAASPAAPAAVPAPAPAAVVAPAPAPKAVAAAAAAPAVVATPKAAPKVSRGQTSQGAAVPSGEAAAAATAGGDGDDDEFARDHRGHGAHGHHHQRHRGDLGHDDHYERAHAPDHLHHGRIRENAPEYGAEHELEHDHRHEHHAAHGRHGRDFSEDDESADRWRPEREIPEDHHHHRTRQASQDDFGRGFAEFGQIGDFESEYDHTADPFPEHDYYEN